jgi:succinyl-CoA synthetase alpha subunit
MMSTIAAHLTGAGVGQSTCVGVGGDLVIGVGLPDAALMAEADPDTDAIALFGELGTGQESRLAGLVREGVLTKPVYAYIAGVAAMPGVRYSHAGAMAAAARSGGAAKRAELADAGAHVFTNYVEMVAALRVRHAVEEVGT